MCFFNRAGHCSCTDSRFQVLEELLLDVPVFWEWRRHGCLHCETFSAFQSSQNTSEYLTRKHRLRKSTFSMKFVSSNYLGTVCYACRCFWMERQHCNEMHLNAVGKRHLSTSPATRSAFQKLECLWCSSPNVSLWLTYVRMSLFLPVSFTFMPSLFRLPDKWLPCMVIINRVDKCPH